MSALLAAFVALTLGTGPQTLVRGEPAPTLGPPAPAHTANQELVRADFEAGIIPSDWLVRIARTGSDSLPPSWFITPTDPRVAIGSGQYMAWVNWDSTQTADEWLISPRLDLGGQEFDEVSLDFLRVYHDPAQWAEEATLVVLASRDDGSTFPDTLYRVTPRSRPGRERVSIDLSAYLGIYLLRIGFHYAGTGGDSAGIDDILVHAGLPLPVTTRSWGRLKIERSE